MLHISLPAQLDLENIQTTLLAIKTANCKEANKMIVLQGQNNIFCLGMSFDYLTRHTAGALQKKIKYYSRIHSQTVIKVKTMIADTINLQLDNALQKGGALLKKALADTQIIDKIRHYTEYGIAPWDNMAYDIN